VKQLSSEHETSVRSSTLADKKRASKKRPHHGNVICSLLAFSELYRLSELNTDCKAIDSCKGKSLQRY
jgi:hypothetical protein